MLLQIMTIIPLSSIKLKLNLPNFTSTKKKQYVYKDYCCNWLLILFSTMVLSRLTKVVLWVPAATKSIDLGNKKNCNSRRSESETESATETVEKWVGNGCLNMGKLFLIGLEIFSMVLSNLSIFHCGVTVFGIPLAGL